MLQVHTSLTVKPLNIWTILEATELPKQIYRENTNIKFIEA